MEITLTLLHPTSGAPLQRWVFPKAQVVRLGRSPDNEVVLPMEVVSRRHAELRRQEAHWELLGLGSNGTFVDGERITQVRLEHGQNIVLAPGGPTLAFKLGGRVPDPTQRTIAVAVPALGISVNERQKALQVAEIAASDYFQQLQKKAAELRARPTAPER